MEKQQLGSTTLKVHPITFGGASLSGSGGGYGFGEISNDQAKSLLDFAFEMGLNLFDSAPIYGFEQSEKTLGEVFKSRRDKVHFISKSGVSWHHTKRVNMTNDPKTTQKMLEQSLRNFQSDYIDLYMIHWPDKNIDIRKPMEVLAKAKLDGKILHIGLCNSNSEDLAKALEIEKIEVLQSESNLFNIAAFDSMSELIEQDNIATMGWGTFDKGILAGSVKVGRQYDKVDARSWAPWWKKGPLKEKLQLAQKVSEYLKPYDLNLIDISINLHKHTQVNTPIIGAKSIAQLESALSSYNKNINNDIFKSCLEIVNESSLF